MRLIGPLPASVSIGAPASTSERTLDGKRLANIADIQPPWHRPTRSTAPPRSSTTTLISARYLSMSKSRISGVAAFQSVTSTRGSPAPSSVCTRLWPGA